MKNLAFYNTAFKCDTEDRVFDFLIENLKPGNRLWSYFINWEKVFANTKPIEMALNTLNYLIGKDNFDDEFRVLLRENRNIAKVIPALVVRGGAKTQKLNILVDYRNKKLIYEDYDFSKKEISDDDIEHYLRFVKETGLKTLIADKKIKNLVDYMIGVEAGLDSNGRKNRSGHVMENIVDVFIKDVCEKNNFRYKKEANAKIIKNEFGYDVPVDKVRRRYDFVVDNRKELFIIETNFYGGGGSKQSSIAGDYRKLFDLLNGRYKFIWITDGIGWKSAAKSLREIFDYNDYLFSLAMLERGILDYILKED